MYRAIREFVQSSEIRCGEFEGHCFIINKIHRDAFILYEEHQLKGETVYPNEPVVVNKATLLKSIDKAAQRIGICVPKGME